MPLPLLGKVIDRYLARAGRGQLGGHPCWCQRQASPALPWGTGLSRGGRLAMLGSTGHQGTDRAGLGGPLPLRIYSSSQPPAGSPLCDALPGHTLPLRKGGIAQTKPDREASHTHLSSPLPLGIWPDGRVPLALSTAQQDPPASLAEPRAGKPRHIAPGFNGSQCRGTHRATPPSPPHPHAA